MTKKDYELIADAIIGEAFTSYNPSDEDFDLVDGMDYDTVEQLAGAIADALKRDNPRFDRSRFLKACGLEAQL